MSINNFHATSIITWKKKNGPQARTAAKMTHGFTFKWKKKTFGTIWKSRIFIFEWDIPLNHELFLQIPLTEHMNLGFTITAFFKAAAYLSLAAPGDSAPNLHRSSWLATICLSSSSSLVSRSNWSSFRKTGGTKVSPSLPSIIKKQIRNVKAVHPFPVTMLI